jgi:tRNA(fMet)-specific endonuclease VapC
MELVYGVEKSAKPVENRKQIEGLINRLEVLGFDSEAASHARPRGLVLVSNNLSEFERVEGLQLANWELG